MLQPRFLFIVAVFLASVLSFDSVCADTVTGSDINTLATVIGGGNGTNDSNDYFGIVTNESPIQINGSGTTINSSLSPLINDVIGEDLSGAGFNLTPGSAEWVINVPIVDPSFIADTFDLNAAFTSDVAFAGNAFSGTQPNALDFELFFDGVSQGAFQAQSGVHTSVSLVDSQVDGSPISEVRITMTLPAGNSFDGGGEEFRVSAYDLNVDWSYETAAVPEPAAGFCIAMLGIFVAIRRRK